ncbi:MAG: hypothetical protein M3384_11745 [Acidobacteriota bacterium]|nr:hypothetical protein [Acidobacteriota bacterium]
MPSEFGKDDVGSKNYRHQANVNIRLTADIIETLDEIHFYANKEMRGKRKKLTKSEFYEIIFKDIINEYKLIGKESRVWKIILS